MSATPAVGAKINGRIVPLLTELQNGDEVEIIRSKAQVPPGRLGIRSWSPARRAPRSAAPPAPPCASNMPASAASILERAFERAEQTLHRREASRRRCHRLARTAVEDVLAAVGRGEMSSGDVVRAVYPDLHRTSASRAQPRGGDGKGWFEPAQRRRHDVQAAGRRTRRAQGGAVPIRGLSGDLPVRFAPKAAPCRATASSAS